MPSFAASSTYDPADTAYATGWPLTPGEVSVTTACAAARPATAAATATHSSTCAEQLRSIGTAPDVVCRRRLAPPRGVGGQQTTANGRAAALMRQSQADKAQHASPATQDLVHCQGLNTRP